MIEALCVVLPKTKIGKIQLDDISSKDFQMFDVHEMGNLMR